MDLQQDGLESFTLIMPEAPGPGQESEFETAEVFSPAAES